MSTKKIFLYFLISIFLNFYISPFSVSAEELSVPAYRFESQYAIDNSMTQDYFLENGQENFSINFRQGASEQNLTLTLRELNFNDIPIGKTVDLNGKENNLERISLAYEYQISSAAELLPFNLPLAIDLKTEILKDMFENTMMERKIMHYWDKENNVWQPLERESVGDINRNSVRAKTFITQNIVAMFIVKNQFEAWASWYPDALTPSSKYNGASNKYPIGTKVMVCRLDNLNKCVKIKIVSTGPYVDNRIVDLTKTAFKAIGNPGGGIVGVRVTPIK